MSLLTLALLLALSFGIGAALSFLMLRPKKNGHLKRSTNTIVFLPARRANRLELAITNLL